MTNSATFKRAMIEFPDRGFDQNGNTTNWHHYAVTFNNGTYFGYLDGILIGSGTTEVTNLTVAWNNNVAMPFIGVGCNTHGGSPALEDEPGGPDYPNHGWFNGVLDELRIYRTALSAVEIQALYLGETLPTRPVAPRGLRLAATGP
jgi:hypothetical protein